MKHLFGVATLTLLALSTACSSLQRQAIGGAVAGVGATTTAAAAFMLDPCSLRPEREQVWCRERDQTRFEGEGADVVAVGLATMLLGGIIYLTGTHLPKPAKPGAWHFSRSNGTMPDRQLLGGGEALRLVHYRGNVAACRSPLRN